MEQGKEYYAFIFYKLSSIRTGRRYLDGKNRYHHKPI